MMPPHDSSRRVVREQRIAGLAIAPSLLSVSYASPVFLAAIALRDLFAEMPMPRRIARAMGPGGDAYLVIDDGADGEGDGRCPGLMALRFVSIPIWSWRE